MSAQSAKFYEAVFFFKGKSVHKEVYFSEFEAVLDGFAGLSDYSGQEVQAVFLKITPKLGIRGAVFFLVDFDDAGKVVETWNLPLRHLMDHADDMLDLGSGPVSVACRSNCPVAWLSDKLWDPDMERGKGSFETLRKAVERNRLGIVVERSVSPPEPVPAQVAPVAPVVTEPAPVIVPAAAPAPAPAPAGPVFHRKYRRRLLALRHEYQLELKTRETSLRQQAELMQADYIAQLNVRDEAIAELRKKLARHRRNELELKESSDLLEQRFHKLRDLYEQSISQGSEETAKQLDTLREEFKAEMQDRLRRQADELTERIDMHESELHYRAERLAQFRNENAELRKQNQQLMQAEGSAIVRRMADSGVTFVAYHPGIEHLVLAPIEIAVYLHNPEAFVAERCGVTEEHYREWLTHYQLPVCRAEDENHQACAEPVDKVMRPQFFRAGDSDRCNRHRGVSSALESQTEDA